MSGPVEGKIVANGISGTNPIVNVKGDMITIGQEINQYIIPPIPSGENSVQFEIRDSVWSFTGRTKELEDLHKNLQCNLGRNKHNLTVISQVTSISGLGGIGKSEIARMYARQHGDEYDGNVIWINAEKYDTLTESFYRLAKDKLNISTKCIDGQQKDINSIVDEVYKYFTKRKSLFIFDNAEKLRTETPGDEGIDKFLPKYLSIHDNEPYIIITSRNQKWGDKIKVLSLGTFTEEEAIEFIKKELHIIDDSQGKEICKLAQTLQCFPLALQQAVAYIKQTDEERKDVCRKFEVIDFLKMYEEKARELLDFDFPEDSSNCYFKTTFITWKVTLEKIEQKKYGKQALEVLETIAYFGPDNISTNIFLELVNGDIEKMASMLQLPKQYSMFHLEKGIINIHRLVQQVMRLRLKDEHKEKETLRRALKLIKTSIEEADADSSKILPHAISAWNYSTNDEIGIFTNELIEFSNRITYKLINDTRYQEAYTFTIQTLELPKKGLLSTPEAEHPDILTTRHNMAFLLNEQGKFNEALGIYQDNLNLLESALGGEHPDTLMTMHNIAFALDKQDKIYEVLGIYKDVLTKQERVLGAEHRDTLMTRHNIAFALDKQGKNDEALGIYEDVLNKQKHALGGEHPDTLMTRHNIAFALNKQGKFDEALGIYQEVLNIQERVLGGEHPKTLMTKHNMANVLNEQGKFDEALEIYQDVLLIKERVLGGEHPDTLLTRHNIAFALDKQDKNDEALGIYQDVLSIQEIVLGAEHPDTLTTRHSMAFLLEKHGKYDEALSIYQDVLNIQERFLGEDHPKTLTTRYNMAIVLNEQGKFDEALQIYQDVLNIQERVLGGEHTDTLITRHTMALLLDKQGKND